MLRVTGADIRHRVELTVFTEKIDCRPCETTARDDRFGKQPVQLAGANRYLLAPRRADPEAGDGLVAEHMPARFQNVGDVFGKLSGIRCRRTRAKLACARIYPQSQRGQAMQSFRPALMYGAKQTGLDDDAGIRDPDS